MGSRQRPRVGRHNLFSNGTSVLSSVDYDKVIKAYDHLGHLKDKIVSPDIEKQTTRDLSMYTQTEALMNVFNENTMIEA